MQPIRYIDGRLAAPAAIGPSRRRPRRPRGHGGHGATAATEEPPYIAIAYVRRFLCGRSRGLQTFLGVQWILTNPMEHLHATTTSQTDAPCRIRLQQRRARLLHHDPREGQAIDSRFTVTTRSAVRSRLTRATDHWRTALL